MTKALPHFLPFRMAYEVKHHFPLARLSVSRQDIHNYILRFEVSQNPIYRPTGMTIRIDMGYVQSAFPDPELSVIQVLEALFKLMSQRIRPNTPKAAIQKHAPWMDYVKASRPDPQLPTSIDIVPPIQE